MTSATGYFRTGDSWLHRRNPATKLLALAWVLVATFLLPAYVLPLLAVIVVGLAASGGLLVPLIRSLRIPAVLIGSILVVNAFFFPGATDRLAGLGPIGLTREGLGFGLVAAGRVLVAFVVSILFLFTTLADDLLEAMVARGASHRIAFVVLSAVQLVPRLQDRARAILEAQQARGLAIEGPVWRRVRALVPLVGPILLGSLIDVRERTFALEARAFGSRPDRTAYRIVSDPPVDRWIRRALAFALVGVVVLGVTGALGR